MSFLFHTLFVNPLYNVLITLLAILPGGDVGIAVVLLTLIVKLILAPLSIRMITTQLKMKEIEPILKGLREKHKKDPMSLMRSQRELYKEHKVRPGANFLLLVIQIIIFLALYRVFFREGFPAIHTDLLYSFTPVPDVVGMKFLGFIDMAAHGITLAAGNASFYAPALGLAILAGITQFIQAKIMQGRMAPSPGGSSTQEELARSLAMTSVYFLPFMIAGISAFLPSAIALYFLTSNIVSIAQEIWVKRRHLKTPAIPEVSNLSA